MRRGRIRTILWLFGFMVLISPLVGAEASEQMEVLPEISGQSEITPETDDTSVEEQDIAEQPETEGESGEENKRENQGELDYIYDRPMTEEEIAGQKAMEPYLRRRINTEPEPEAVRYTYRARSVLPERYDSRDYGYITPVRDQNPFDTCWAFAIDTVAETSLIMNQMADAQNADLSELHTAYYFYNRWTDPLNLTEGDINIPEEGYDYRSNGGNLLMSAFAFANWTGTESEQDAPYTWAYEDLPPFTEDQQFSADAKLKNAYFINSEVSQVKEAILRFGSVAVMYYHNGGRYLNYSTSAFCNPADSAPYTDHAVAIVGWDDTFKKENFKSESNVMEDGAWIVKNSWGDTWGAQGYFYISYEEPTICNVTALEFQDGDAYQYNYQYDGSSMTTAYTVGEGQKLANVFEVQGASSEYEVLEAVNFALRGANVPYSIQVYTDLQSERDPTSGTAVFEKDLGGVTGYSGIHTVELPKAVRVMAHTKFSVVISFLQDTVYYAERTTDSDYSSWVSARAVTAPGQSFWLNSGGDWQDLGNSGICARIKAFTNESSSVGEDRVTVGIKNTAGTQILLEWTVQSGAEGYIIYRSTTEKGEYSYLDTVNGEQTTTYADDSVEPDVKYYYRVKWYVNDNEVMRESLSSNVVSAISLLAVPEMAVSSVDYNSVTLTWGESKGADGCQIWRSTKKDSGFSMIAEVKGKRSYVDGKRSTGVTYYYKIRVFHKLAGRTVYSAGSDIVAAKPQLKQPVLSGSSGGYHSAYLTWKKIEGAQGYCIFRSSSKENGYKGVKNLADPSKLMYSDMKISDKETLKTGTTYYYKIRAYRKAAGVICYSEPSRAVAVTPALKTPVLTGRPGDYKSAALSWNKVWGASGYQIYRSVKATSGFSVVRNVTNGDTLSYTNSSLSTGKTYYYKVRAFRTVNGKTYYSASSKPVGVKPIPGQVCINSVSSPAGGKLKISWGKVSGADGYQIYRTDGTTGKYSQIKTMNGNGNVVYTDSPKKTGGKKYYYKIRAFRKVANGTVYGGLSPAKAGIIK
ncbi:C1 family peptidase [Ruminococcus gauvreauii]|uniref:C1 family peptidase n=1 Tax=Ruminococcus gauvreauii TaxID=438033 RepID=UPI003983E19A